MRHTPLEVAPVLSRHQISWLWNICSCSSSSWIKALLSCIHVPNAVGRETELVYLLQEYATRPSHFPFSHNMRYSIRNPEMHHQILEIPDSRSHILSMCIMFDPDFQVLKLLSYIDFSVKSIDYEVLVQNEESSNSWRPLINLPQQRQGDTRMCNKQSKQIKVLFAMGTGYMLCEATANTVNDSYVWSYYFSYELLHERRLHILECKAIIR